MSASEAREGGRLLRPSQWRPPDRYVRLAISHSSNDPMQHRTFQIRAAFTAARHGWQASVSPQQHNDQYGAWAPLGEDEAVFPTAAACLGHAATVLIASFDEETGEP